MFRREPDVASCLMGIHKCSATNFWGVPTALATAVILTVACAPCSWGQILYGSLVGNVTDPSQAAVAGASVTITNQGTGAKRSLITNNDGSYAFVNLDPGEYKVEISKDGFRQHTVNDVAISINAITRVDATLRLGAVTETIEVSGAALALQTDRADIRFDLSSKALANLPLPPGRNYQQLFVTLPGFAPPENAHSIPANPSRGLRMYVNGTTSNTVNTRIDGASSTNIYIPHIAGYVPSLEAIETVNVVSSSFDAEQGLAGGAAINVQIKSGTNEFHGSVFAYHNNNRTKAKPFFLPQGERNPKLVYNQLGGTLGGPIQRNKLFFFGAYEGTFDHKLGTGIGSIPTAAMRAGDLSASRTAIYDPATGAPDGAGRVPIPGNLIPASRIDARVAKILPLYPAPNIAAATPQRNYYAAASFAFHRHTWDTKLNWNISDKLTTYGRASVLRFSSDNPQWFGAKLGGPPIVSGQPGHATGQVYNTTVAGTYIFSPALVMDAYFGYSYMTVDSRQPRLEERVGLDFLGIPGTNGSRLIEGGWPQFAVDNFTAIGITNNFMPMFQDDPQYQWVANLNWTKSAHNIRAGLDIYHLALNQAQPELSGAPFGAAGGFGFAQGQTRLRNGPVGSEFNSFASFLLGVTNRLGRTALIPDELRTRNWQYAAYVRDRWQVNRKLTLSYGVRWEYFPLIRRDDRGIEIYDWDKNKMLICGVGSTPRDCGVPESKKRFVPRFGLAYRASDTVVIRSGYGITNDPYTLIRAFRGNFPVILASDLVSPDGFAPASQLRDGIPIIPAPNLSGGVVDIDGRVALFSLMRGNWKRGYIQSWNLVVQKQFRGWLGELGYVGTRSVDQPGNIDRNAGYPGGGNASRPLNRKFGRVARTSQVAPIGTNTYDSLQAKLERRFAAGIQTSVSYTFSKAMAWVGNENSDGVPRINLPEYFFLNRGRSSIDRPHSFHATGIADLPFGRGKRWVSSGIRAAILGGWQVNGILSLYSGPPFSVTAPGADLNAPGNTQRADLVKRDVQKFGRTGPGQKFYDPTAFAQVREPRFGTAGFNLLRGPGCVNLDAGIFRRFPITERFHLQLRVEAFNSTNTPKFGDPNGDVSSSQFMEVTSTRGLGREGIDERVFRFGLRLGW